MQPLPRERLRCIRTGNDTEHTASRPEPLQTAAGLRQSPARRRRRWLEDCRSAAAGPHICRRQGDHHAAVHAGTGGRPARCGYGGVCGRFGHHRSGKNFNGGVEPGTGHAAHAHPSHAARFPAETDAGTLWKGATASLRRRCRGRVLRTGRAIRGGGGFCTSFSYVFVSFVAGQCGYDDGSIEAAILEPPSKTRRAR